MHVLDPSLSSESVYSTYVFFLFLILQPKMFMFIVNYKLVFMYNKKGETYETLDLLQVQSRGPGQ